MAGRFIPNLQGYVVETCLMSWLDFGDLVLNFKVSMDQGLIWILDFEFSSTNIVSITAPMSFIILQIFFL